jgi:predicted Zn-dependent protease
MVRGKLLGLALLAAMPAPAWQRDGPPRQDPALALAVQQARSGKCGEAVETLRSRLHTAPKPEEGVYRLLADCDLTLGQPGDALQTLRDGMRAYPASPLIAGGLGQLLFRQHFDSAEAGQLLALAAKALPQDPESHHYYAQWAYLNSRERICLQEEQSALRVAGLNDLALLQMNTLLGMCAGKLEDAGTARAAFHTAQEVNLRLPAFDPVAAYQNIQYESRYGDDSKV